jgi:hypothetical protein
MMGLWITFDLEKKLLYQFKFSFILGNDVYLGIGCVQVASNLCGIMIGVTSSSSYEMALCIFL